MDPDPQPAQTTTPRPPRWGLGDFALGLVSGFTLSGLTGSLWMAVTGSSEGLGSKAASQVGFWTGMVFVVLVASRLKGSGRLSEDFGFRARWPDLGIGVVVALVVQLLVLPGVALALRPLLGDPEVSQPVRDLLDEAQGAAYFGLIASVAVGAPLVE